MNEHEVLLKSLGALKIRFTFQAFDFHVLLSYL
jgi:hypothetical protein